MGILRSFPFRAQPASGVEEQSFDIVVGPLALFQTALPGDADLGEMALTVTAEDDAASWLFYGSTVQKATSSGSTSIGVPID